MKKPLGLYTEIVVTISLLLAAALLFTGFLLVGLTQQELVEQRVKSVAGMVDILSRAVAASPADSAEDFRSRVDLLSDALSSATALESWGVVDHALIPQSLSNASGGFELDMADLSQVRESGTPSILVYFPSPWNPFAKQDRVFVRITQPILDSGIFRGALQGQFSLEDVRLRVMTAQRLVFLYALVYGGILLLFGAYILNRTIAKPVRRLKRVTGLVASGDLEQALPEDGPREVAEVASSFNRMLVALKSSRLETLDSIESLRQMNTELRNTRDELVRTEKMASVGHLAAGMAHEIGNPLGATIGYLELLKSELEQGRNKDMVGHALAETERIDRLVRDLLDYATPSDGRTEAIDVVAVVREACELLSHQGAFKEIHCVDLLPSSLGTVAIVRHQLQQVLVNLLLNAVDALDKDGEIELSGGEEEEQVWLKVSDNGVGMSLETKESLFDPFYTTKPPGEGRGLGLSVCHRIISDVGGRIEVESEQSVGSCFVIWLPKENGNDESA